MQYEPTAAIIRNFSVGSWIKTSPHFRKTLVLKSVLTS